MALHPKQIELLTELVSDTRERELDCEEFLPHLAAWSERVAAGQSIEEATREVQHHLKVCPECAEEFRVLIEVITENPPK